MKKVWKFAVTTDQGIFQGEMEGIPEPGETDEQAMQTVSDIVKDYLRAQKVTNVLACFVIEGTLHIDAPDTDVIHLNVDTDLTLY